MLNSAVDHVFTIAPLEVALDQRLNLEQIRVLLALFSFRDSSLNPAMASIDQIVVRCGYDSVVVVEILRELIAYRLVTGHADGLHYRCSMEASA